MRCRFCGYLDSKVIDSRPTDEGLSIRRRRECIRCGKRFTTYEKIEMLPVMVVKKDLRREAFNAEKIKAGLIHACQKRPVSSKMIEDLVERIVLEITDKYEREVPGEAIGKLVMAELRQVDQVAYVRYASVYRRFQEATDFVQEVRKLEGIGDHT